MIGTMDMSAITGRRNKIVVDPQAVYRLARQGLSRHQIAERLEVCYTTFRRNLLNTTIQQHWKQGAIEAGTFAENKVPRTRVELDEVEVFLRAIDVEVILPALKKKKQGQRRPPAKRVREVCEITGLIMDIVVPSLERLVIHHKATVSEGLMFTTYEACE